MNGLENLSTSIKTLPTGAFITLLILAIWTLIWKGMALWRASKKDDKGWFIALLILNTVGLLEIFYLYYWSKRDEEKELPEIKNLEN